MGGRDDRRELVQAVPQGAARLGRARQDLRGQGHLRRRQHQQQAQGRRGLHEEAEGEEHVLNEFVSWCKKGSPNAVVKAVKATEGDLKKFSEFRIDR